MHIQRKFNLFVEGFSTHMIVESVTPPVVADKMEDVTGGGLLMDQEVSMGLAKMEAGFKVNARAKLIMERVGLAPGTTTRFTFRSVNVAEVDGTQENEVIEVVGRLSEGGGDWTAGSVPKDDYKIGGINFYKHSIDGKVIHHIDPRNFIGIVKGQNVWGSIAAGLGF